MTDTSSPAYNPDGRLLPADRLKKWEGCRACPLGELRDTRGAHQVFSEGQSRGLMIIGAGPSWREEKQGRFFAESWQKEGTPHKLETGGDLVRGLIAKFKIDAYYLTGITLCRPCVPYIGDDGVHKTRDVWQRGSVVGTEPAYNDAPAPHPAVKACGVRIQEEIYSVDPFVIVTLGPEATQAVTGKAEMVRDSYTLEIEGVTRVPRYSEARGAWGRKFKGKVVYASDPLVVKYLVIPTLLPELVLKRSASGGAEGELSRFARDIKRAWSLVLERRKELTTMETAI